MANEQLFNNRAENYAKGRLGYAEGVIDLLFCDIVKESDIIADVGSGTGIFAREFTERGFDVFCVEPNEEMRAQAEVIFASDRHYIPVAATAENTTLPDGCVNLVTAASAFHWFDAQKFRTECKRILKPHGVFFSVMNARTYDDPLTLRQHEICAEYCKNFTSLRHGLDKSLPRLQDFFDGNMRTAEFDFPLEYTKESFISRSLSSSYAPDAGTAAYEKYTEKLSELLDEFAYGSDKFTVSNVSVACWGEIS